MRFLSMLAQWRQAAAWAIALAVVGVSSIWWGPALRSRLASVADTSAPAEDPSEAENHEGHDHAGHDDATSLEISPQARRGMGLKTTAVELQTYAKTISVPAMVVERPGQTLVQVAAPMTGLVTEVYAVRGESVRPGDVLFKLQLTHEDLVDAQKIFLQTLEELDVENREIERLRQVTRNGAIAGKTLLERQYARDKLQAQLRSQRQALLLHGLSENHVEQIRQTRELHKEVLVRAPSAPAAPPMQEGRIPAVAQTTMVSQTDGDSTQPPASQLLSVNELKVHRNEFVQVGGPMAVLADYTRLYIEGRAFEQDADALIRAANEGWRATAVFEDRAGEPQVVENLEIAYVSNEVNPETRAFYFYVELPNQPVRDVTRQRRRFITYKYKRGQRMELLVPVEKWPEKIVLPIDAVAEEGAETYVFVQNGDHFDRRPVTLQYRDQQAAVVAHDGALFPGEVVVANAAHQLQMALKKKASGGGGAGHHGHVH